MGEVIVLVAVDNSNGLLFNHRRVSRDRVLREKIVSISKLILSGAEL